MVSAKQGTVEIADVKLNQIKEIAISTGYPNALNFSTEFRRITGCSPSDYRTRKQRTFLPQVLETLPEIPAVQDDYLL
jgi:AraC-like DNA-binding protein